MLGVTMDTSWLKEYVAAVQVTYFQDEEVVCRSTSSSLDVNDHILEVADRLVSLPGTGSHGGTFEIYYKGKRMFIGDGPRISRKSISRIAALGADIGQDIYCMCAEVGTADRSDSSGLAPN